MTKLLQINTTLNWGSTGRIVEEIGRMVQGQHWESYIAYGRYANPTHSIGIPIGTKWDIYIHGLLTRLFDRHGLGSVAATRTLVDTIRKIRPDIIHLHNIHGYYLNYQLLFDYLSSSDIPVVWTLHDCWAFTGHCAYYSYVGCEKWKTGCASCKNKHKYPSSNLLDRSRKNFLDKRAAFTSVKKMVLTPVSNWLASEVKNSFLGTYPIRVIHNGIDLEQFAPQCVGKSRYGLEGKFVLLGVASVWDERKGLDDFIRLRSLLPEEYAIVLIGLTASQIRRLPEGIRGVIRTNSVHELAQYYSMADVFFNPTWEDNFPTTNLEALACGTPAITYQTGGSPEAVNEQVGWVVPQGDLGKVVEILSRMTQDDKISYIRHCREYAVRKFDKHERYKEYLDLYHELIPTP